MLLAWLDAGILTATDEEALRIQQLKDMWHAVERAFQVPEMIAVFVHSTLAHVVVTLLGTLISELTPDLDAEFANFQSALNVFKESFNTIAREVLQALLFDKVLGDELREIAHPEIPYYAKQHGVFVLGGWDEELRFLRLRA